MRTHLLRQIPLTGREKALVLEPEFDFYRATRVLSLEVVFGNAADRPSSLRLVLSYEAVMRRYTLSLLFEEVRELVIPTMSPGLFLPELEVEDLRERGMEGVSFEMISHFERSFRCTCGNITLLAFELCNER